MFHFSRFGTRPLEPIARWAKPSFGPGAAFVLYPPLIGTGPCLVVCTARLPGPIVPRS
jgi:hypothetical protein